MPAIVKGPLQRTSPSRQHVELVYRDVDGGVTLLNAENLTTRVLMTNSTFRQLNAVDFRVSGDLNNILLISDIKKVYKHSYDARYYVYEVQNSNHHVLSLLDDDVLHPQLQHVVWAPRGNAIAFVLHNDIYYKPNAVQSTVYRVTTSGRPGVIFNGVPDWLYDEEILKSGGALWFSPDAHFLLFACFNDSLVGELKYPWYGRIQERERYPQIKKLRYPKAGTKNPVVTLWVVDLNHPTQLTTMDLKPPVALKASSQSEWDHYFTSVSWLAGHQVAVVWMNRVQNISIISICRPSVWTCEDALVVRSEPRGWVEVYDAPLFSADGSSFLARLPVLEGEYGYYKHVCHVDVGTKRITALTQGRFVVTEILAWDEENHFIYFVAAPEHKPGERHLYKIGDLNNTMPGGREMECLTCPPLEPSQSPYHQGLDILSSTAASGTSGDYNTSELASWPPCLYVAPHLSHGASPRYYVLECLGPDPPSAALVEMESNTRLTMLDSQPALRDRLANMASPQVKTFKVELEGGDHAHVRLHLPPGLREDEEMTFPLVLHVCAAPGSQLVSEQWVVDWGTYLASYRNFIVAQIDGRGSGYQGDRLLHEIYYRLGSVEIEDQIAVIKYLRDNLKFVDKERIAVWGWSYGGFAAAMILAQDTGIFRCGVAVAPITSWAHYDSVYTERYMGTPNVTDNYRGYEEADITKRAGNLRNKMFLLVHGTADHTVHYQQSMLLVRALTDQGVLFRHQTYADEGNTFSGVQHHFYKAMESFLDDCFGPLDFEEWEIGTSFFTFKQ